MNDTEVVSKDLALTEPQTQMILAATPAEAIKTRQGRGGQMLKYVSTSYIVKRLNEIFGYAWSFETENITPPDLLSKNLQIIVKGKLTVFAKGGQGVTKEQFGSAEVKVYGQNNPRKGEPIDVGDDFKAASSDALKKCASLFGIAADVYTGGFSSGPGSDQGSSGQAPPQSDKPRVDPSDESPATEKQKKFLMDMLERKKVVKTDFLAHCHDTWKYADSEDNPPMIPSQLKKRDVDAALEYIRQYKSS